MAWHKGVLTSHVLGRYENKIVFCSKCQTQIREGETVWSKTFYAKRGKTHKPRYYHVECHDSLYI